MIQNLLFGVVYLLILDFLGESQSQEKIAIRMNLLQYSFAPKTQLILRISTHSAFNKKYTLAVKSKT